MQINIQARNFELTEALENYVRRRVHFAFSTRYDQIRHITVRLSDINGPRGGADKRCSIQASLDSIPNIVVDDTQLDLYVAIDRATCRIQRTINRRLSKLVQKPRRFEQRHRTPAEISIDQII